MERGNEVSAKRKESSPKNGNLNSGAPPIEIGSLPATVPILLGILSSRMVEPKCYRCSKWPHTCPVQQHYNARLTYESIL